MWRRARLEGVPGYIFRRAVEIPPSLFRRLQRRTVDVAAVRRSAFPDSPTSLADLCQRGGIPFVAVDSLNSAPAREQLAKTRSDLGVVIGTRILAHTTFSIPRLGSINLHKGKVPDYRGQPPGFWELYHGEHEAGVTVHQVVERLDAGPVVAVGTVKIVPGETEHSLRAKLDARGAQTLLEAVEALAQGRAAPTIQPAGGGRVFTTPTPRERAEFERRRGIRVEPAAKQFFKTMFYAVLLSGGPVALRNLILRLLRRTRYTVLLFHRVTDEARDHLTVSVGRFIEQLDCLSRRYKVMSLDQALDASRSRRFLGPNVVVLTFDDGYADNAERAAPLLEHFRLPCTFFVSAGIVGTERAFPHDSGSPYRFANLTWGQILRMHRAGFEIGSHSWSHLNLGRCSLDEARREIVSSRELLTRMLGVPAKAFAYPFGGADDVTPEAKREIVAAGFETVASAYGGSNVGVIDPLNVRRVAVNDTSDPLTLRAMIEGIDLANLRRHFVRRLLATPRSVDQSGGSGRAAGAPSDT
jgi:peptidoglycan/xylan/chitin deacetylase (PgdA/CDA1 family)